MKPLVKTPCKECDGTGNRVVSIGPCKPFITVPSYCGAGSCTGADSTYTRGDAADSVWKHCVVCPAKGEIEIDLNYGCGRCNGVGYSETPVLEFISEALLNVV